MLWVLLCIVIVVVIVRQVKEGFGFDNSERYVTAENNFDMNALANTRALYPRDSIDVLADAKFKPECCLPPYSNPYSNRDGCLCPSSNDAGLIITRGGNR